MSGHDWRFPDRSHRGARAGRACRGMAQKKHVATAHTVGYLRGVLGYCSTLRTRRSARSGSGVGRGQWAHRTGNRGVASHPPGKNLTRAESICALERCGRPAITLADHPRDGRTMQGSSMSAARMERTAHRVPLGDVSQIREAVWSGTGSNCRPSAFQVNRAKRCADLRKRTSLTSKTALGGRCKLYANRAYIPLYTPAESTPPGSWPW
jgi:hypothetical protein